MSSLSPGRAPFTSPPEAARAEGPVTVLHGREHAEPLAGLLWAAGLGSLHVPMISLRAVAAPPPTVAPTAVLVSSPSTARFCPGLADLDAPIFAVGEGTELALRALGCTPRWTGAAGGAEAVESLRSLVEDGALGVNPVVWAVGAQALSPPLQRALDSLVGVRVARWAVYENATPDGLDAALAAAPAWSAALLASGSAVAAYVSAGGAARCPDAALVAIGGSTAAAIVAAGLRCAGVAARPSPEALVAAARSALQRP